MTEFKAEQESSSKDDDLYFSALQVGKVCGEGLTSISSKISPETVMILPVAEVSEGGSTLCIGVMLLMCSVHPLSSSVS